MRDLPSGTVTLLFTDIEGSTRLLHEIGVAYADALAAHRRALRSAFQGRGGVEVDTAGDAFFYAFADATQAVAAATEAQQALSDGPIRVRIGLHTGEPMVTDEGYVGIDVHHAARVMAAGHGGQVLVSEATAALVGADGLTELGRHRLKDMTTPERLFQVGTATFPPLRTLDATNLPVVATALVGREAEVGELTGLLTNGTRLVSVTGPGGTGKTRVALQAASELVGRFSDGVFWVPLAAVTDPELVLPEVARAVGAGDLMAHARDREMLLLLDNLEQVLGAAAYVSELLAGAPRCRVLATSRTVLHVSGEREFPLGPLAEDAAAVLFCERARAAGRTVEPDGVVRDICRRLDGLPLAIELAAARSKLLSPTALRDRLAHSLALLTGGPGDAPQRQRTLRATIEWSYNLLGEAERDVFARLAVFAGGATLAAVEAVCAADLDALAALVDSSLVKVVDAADGDARLLLLETIREYAAEQLSARPDLASALAHRHARHYAELAQTLWMQRRRAGQAPAAVGQLDAESPNFRLAEQWACEAGETDLQLQLLMGADAQYLRGSQSAYRDRLQAVVRAGGSDVTLLARAHATLSFVAYRLGEFEESQAMAQRALEIGEQCGDRLAVAMAYNYLSNRDNAEGRYDRARELIQRSMDVWRQLGDDRGVLVCQVNLSDVALSEGQYELAVEAAAAALESARRFGDPEVTPVAAVNAALASFHLGRLADAKAYNDEGLGIARSTEDQATIVCCLRVSVGLSLRAGRAIEAAHVAGVMERIRTDIDLDLEPSERQLHTELMGELEQILGRDGLAREMRFGAALSIDEVLATALP